MTDDRLRAYPHWLSSRNLSNEASDESVQALIEAVRARYELPRRWYRLKAQLLGHRQARRLRPHGRGHAGQREGRLARGQAARARRLLVVLRRARLARRSASSTRRWIDGPVRPGKRGGAFCSYGVPSVHPYVMLNYTYLRRDVLTLAHELGHGVHAALGLQAGRLPHGDAADAGRDRVGVRRDAGLRAAARGLAVAGVASLSLLAESIEGSIATVFRQVAMNRFEHLVHTARRDEGELSVDRFGELWAQSQEELLGDAVEVTEGYRSWWSYVPHFIASPGYVYAYAYGQLLALAVYGRYEEEGPELRVLLPRAAQRGRLALARGAGRDRRRRPRRPGLLGQGPGPRGAQARRGRAAARAGRVEERRLGRLVWCGRSATARRG